MSVRCLLLHVLIWSIGTSEKLEITQITTESLGSADGLHYDENSQTLYFVDVEGSTVHKYVPKTGEYASAVVGGRDVAIIVPVANATNKFIITYGNSIASIIWDGISKQVSNLTIIATVEDPYPEFRLNDGKMTAGGVLFVGSMLRCNVEKENKPVGNLYAINGTAVKKVLSGVRFSNGLVLSHDQKHLYFIDSLSYEVVSYDYNASTIELTNKRTVINTLQSGIPDGEPDGITVDTKGYLWLAVEKFGSVIQIDPENGTILNSIRMPVANVTNCAFAGPYLRDLIVSSANIGLTASSKQIYPLSGVLFSVCGTGAQGFPGVPTPDDFPRLNPNNRWQTPSGAAYTPCL